MHVSWIVLILVNIRIDTYKYHLKANTMLQPPNWPSLWGETECLRPRWRFGEALHWASKLQWLTDTQREAYRPCYLIGIAFWKETPIIQQKSWWRWNIIICIQTYGPPRHPVIYIPPEVNGVWQTVCFFWVQMTSNLRRWPWKSLTLFLMSDQWWWMAKQKINPPGPP